MRNPGDIKTIKSPPVCHGTRTRRVFLSAFILYLAAVLSPAGPQEGTGLPAEELLRPDPPEVVELRLDPAAIGQSDAFTVTMLVDARTADLAVTAPSVPEGIRLLKGPSIQPFVGRAAAEGSGRNKTQVSFTYRADAAGRFVLDPFLMEAGGRSWITEPVLLEVGLKSSPKTVPFEVRWRLLSATAYEGETLPLVLEIVKLREIVFPDSIKVSSPTSGMFEASGGLGDIRSELVGNNALYTVPVATYMFTPTRSGEILIPSAQVSALGLTRTSAPRTLLVRPVPAAVEQTGAVGTFTVDSRLESSTVVSGDRAVLHVKIAGSGNLGYLQIPVPVSDSLIMTERTESSAVIPSDSGYTGHREMIFNFRAESPGTAVIRVPRFAWFDPSDGSVKMAPESVFKVRVLPGNGKTDGSTDGFPFLLLSGRAARALRSWDFSGNPYMFLLYVPGPVLLALFVFFRKKPFRRKRRVLASSLVIMALLPLFGFSGFPEKLFTAGSNAFAEGDYDAACTAFRAASEQDPRNAGIAFNLFTAAYRAGRHGEAVAALRKAVFLKPMNGNFREALAWLDERLELGRQVPVSPSVHPDVLLFIGAFFVNFTCLSAAFLVKGRRGMYIILFVLSLFFSAGTVGSLAWTLIRRADTLSVIGPEAGSLRKIPRQASGEWFSLKPGTAVRVISRTGEFYLIETGYGIQGWIPSDDLLAE